MKKVVLSIGLVLVSSIVLAEDLSDPAAMALKASKVVEGIQAPSSAKIVVPTGIQVVPSLSGGVISADVWTFKDSVAKVGVLRTIAQIPVQFPKTITAASVLAIAIPIVANNPKLLGLEKKETAPAASQATPATPTTVSGINVNVSGNSGSTINVVVKPNTENAQ